MISFIKQRATISTANNAILGSILAADGLVNDSITSLIPSMIISPIGSIIIKLARNFNNKFNYLLLAMTIAIAVGAGYGYTKLYKHLFPTKEFPTKEMYNRTNPSGLVSNVIVAAISALAFNVAVNKTDEPSLIAIGIATSLLPPLVNIGCLLAVNDRDIEHYLTTSSIFLINFAILFIGIKFFDKKLNIKQVFSTNISIIVVLTLAFYFIYK